MGLGEKMMEGWNTGRGVEVEDISSGGRRGAEEHGMVKEMRRGGNLSGG